MPVRTGRCSFSLRACLAMTLVLCALSLVVAGCSSSSDATSSSTDAGLFDSSILHEVSVSFSQEDYDALIKTYEDSGEKDWIKATVTIDGETYENVGMRLKGNSSIMSLRGEGVGGMGGDARPGFPGAAGGPSGAVSTDAPEGLPWLIDLDKSVDGQNHEGLVEFCVRSNSMETGLNEAVSLDLLEEAGLASQEASAARFSVNGSAASLRLLVENPDDRWMAENFDIGGALYKAESTGDYSYRGDDPDAYDEIFDQEAGKKNADLIPLIGFLDFVNNSDDDTFNAGLAERLDVDSFATYLALEELLANADDIDGMGNNSYLYYDTKTGRFTVVAWDHNLAFSGMGGAGGGEAPALPDGVRRPEGARMPGGVQAPDGAQTTPPVGGRGMGRSNTLVERFRANPEWTQLYEERLAELTSRLYESGVAAAILAEWVTLLKTQASDLVDSATVDTEAAVIAAHLGVE